jgi:uncharacterized protein YndB with AHSA1/START domain
MTRTSAPLLEHRIEIDAPPARVWPLVSDLSRMPEWSPQVDSVRMKADVPAVGVRFTNKNSHGELVWVTHGEIVRFEPEREVAFRIDENWVVWSFHLEPTASGGTLLVQRREAPDGISPLSLDLADSFFGGQEPFTATMRAGMEQTLAAIRDAVSAPALAGD